MPARRPYASRGVPRRATIRRSGGAGSAAGVASLVAVVAVIAAAIIWIANPFSATNPSGRSAPASSPAGSGQSAGDASAPFAALQAASDTTPGTDSINATPMTALTFRHWDAGAAGIVSDAALASQLDQALLGVDGQIGVAVKDLGSGRGAVLGGDLELPAASLYKLPVLYAVFDVGLKMAEQLPITDDALSYDAGTMELGVGETLSVAEALERMITISDNTSAVMLGGRVGPSRVNAGIAALGMDTTHYSLARMTTSALDMLHFLDVLAHGKAVSPAASADMLHLLLRQRVNDRLPRLLPDGVRIAHKTGNLPGTVNDVGIVYGPSATLAIAILVSDTSDEAAAASGIARAALAAVTYFEEQPEVAGRPRIPAVPSRAIPPVWREPRPVPTPTPTPSLEPTSFPVLVDATPTVAASVAVPTARPSVAPRTAPATAVPTTVPAPVPAAPTARPPTATPAPRAPTRVPTRPPPATPVAPAAAPLLPGKR